MSLVFWSLKPGILKVHLSWRWKIVQRLFSLERKCNKFPAKVKDPISAGNMIQLMHFSPDVKLLWDTYPAPLSSPCQLHLPPYILELFSTQHFNHSSSCLASSMSVCVLHRHTSTWSRLWTIEQDDQAGHCPLSSRCLHACGRDWFFHANVKRPH